MTDWNHLGVVDTTCKDECEFSASSSSSSSLSLTSALQHAVEAWSQATGHETDISILVSGTCFHLHKDLLTSRSSYLKRHLAGLSHFTLSPPLNITADTFTLVAGYCYSSNVQITPFNVGALRTATELLGMNESRGNDDNDNLCQLTEARFRSFIGFSQEYATMVLHSCIPLLPEAETTASLVSRCIEALISADDDCQNVDFNFKFLDDVVKMQPEDFQKVMASMNKRIRNHDVLYKIIDFYLTENNLGKLTEEQKIQICNSIDCTKLSTKSLIDCIQNPTMPLRFIVRAMLADQLNSRLSTVSSDGQARSSRPQPHPSIAPTTSVLTLGHHLQRDSAIRQARQLKEAMDSTRACIRSLEKELSVMKKILRDHQTDEEQRNNMLSESGRRSVSFHFVPTQNSKIKTGERRCSSFRFDTGAQDYAAGKSSSSEGSSSVETPRMSKTFRQRLISGIKNAFRVSNSSSK